MCILELSALELGKKIKSGEVTVLEAVEACLGRMKEMEPGIHAYVTVVDEEQAMERAKEVDRKSVV